MDSDRSVAASNAPHAPHDSHASRPSATPRATGEERILAHRMEVLGLLGRDLAHQSNNDLAAILGFASVMRRRADVPADLRDASGMLDDAGASLSRVVQPLIEVIRTRPPERVAVSVGALVRRTLDLAGPLLEDSDVVVDLEADLPEVEADVVLLRQALLSIVVATGRVLREAPGRRRLLVRGRVAGDPGRRRAVLELEDDGPATRPAMPGEPLILEIVAAHGGTLRVEPATGATGWRTVLELPVERADVGDTDAIAGTAGPIPAAPLPADAATGSAAAAALPIAGSLLVVDDEEFVRRVIGRLLEREGFEVVVAASGLEAIAMLARGGIGAVLCDHRMPDLTGLQVAACAHALQPHLAGRVLVMSGDPDDDALVTATREGRIRVLAKPFDAAAVAPLLRENLPA